MTERDLSELLGLMNPFADEAGEFTERDEARLSSIIAMPVTGESAALPAGRGRGRRGHGRRRWVTGGVLLAVAATAAFVFVREQTASDPLGVVCYRTADLDGDRALVEPSLDVVVACAAPWRDGTFSTSGPPRLQGCVNDAGKAVALPGDASVCQRLGLADLVAGRSPEQQATVEFGEQLADVFGADCYRQDEAMALAQELLDESDLTGWTVELAEDFPPGFECGVATPLPGSRTVLVGGARPAP